jgi:cysteine synthase A
MENIKNNITQLIGNTPLLELGNFAKNHQLKARILGKLEYFNPAGSVKDRIAMAMIEAGEKQGILKREDLS